MGATIEPDHPVFTPSCAYAKDVVRLVSGLRCCWARANAPRLADAVPGRVEGSCSNTKARTCSDKACHARPSFWRCMTRDGLKRDCRKKAYMHTLSYHGIVNTHPVHGNPDRIPALVHPIDCCVAVLVFAGHAPLSLRNRHNAARTCMFALQSCSARMVL